MDEKYRQFTTEQQHGLSECKTTLLFPPRLLPHLHGFHLVVSGEHIHHIVNIHTLLYTSLIAISSLVFLNRVSSGNHGWKKEDSTTLFTTPSTTLATLESLIFGFLLLLNPFLLKVSLSRFLTFTITKSFFLTNLKSFCQGIYLESYTI